MTRNSGSRRPPRAQMSASTRWSANPPSRPAPFPGARRRRPAAPRRRPSGGPGAGTLPSQFLRDHGQRALRQVAEVVGQIGVDAADDRLVRVVAVLAERHLAQEEVAQRVDAVGSASANGSMTLPTDFDIFSPRLNRKPWTKTRLRQRQSRRHQECRPVDRVEADDVLADDVHVGRPDSASAGSPRPGSRRR